VRPGANGRTRAVGAEHYALGVTALVNAALDGSHRLLAFAELLGRLMLHPQPATAVLATHTETERARRSARLVAANAFAAELVLPVTATRREAALAETVAARESSADEESRVAQVRASVLADLLQTYRVPPSIAISRLDEAWHLTKEQWRQLLMQPSPVLARCLASAGSTTMHVERQTAADLPPRFLTLLITEVVAGRSSLQGAAELAGLDVSELQPMIPQTRPKLDDALDDGWLDAGPAVA
jgi:hypothetical protein